MSRIAVKNKKDVSQEDSNSQLEKIDESYKHNSYATQAKSGSISISNRRCKPYSANQQNKKLNSQATAPNNIIKKQY